MPGQNRDLRQASVKLQIGRFGCSNRSGNLPLPRLPSVPPPRRRCSPDPSRALAREAETCIPPIVAQRPRARVHHGYRRWSPCHWPGAAYRVIRSLPGRYGSPRKFTPLPKRFEHVAIVRSHPSRKLTRMPAGNAPSIGLVRTNRVPSTPETLVAIPASGPSSQRSSPPAKSRWRGVHFHRNRIGVDIRVQQLANIRKPRG